MWLWNTRAARKCAWLSFTFFIVVLIVTHHWQILLLQHVWSFETSFCIKYTQCFIDFVVFNSEKHSKQKKKGGHMWCWHLWIYHQPSDWLGISFLYENCVVKVQLWAYLFALLLLLLSIVPHKETNKAYILCAHTSPRLKRMLPLNMLFLLQHASTNCALKKIYIAPKSPLRQLCSIIAQWKRLEISTCDPLKPCFCHSTLHWLALQGGNTYVIFVSPFQSESFLGSDYTVRKAQCTMILRPSILHLVQVACYKV